MTFNIYGRFQIEVQREQDAWVAYHLSLGKRRRVDELAIPPDMSALDIAGYLDDFFHEYAEAGRRVERVS